MKSGAHFIGLMAVLAVLSWFALRPNTFFSSDTGLRYLQTQQLISHEWRSAKISYPASQFDPAFDHVPYYYGYSILNQTVFFSISIFFPLMASYFLAAFGLPGLALWLPIGGVLTAAAVLILGRLLQFKRPFLWLWLAVFATPIAFYTLQFWDHALAVGFTTMGIAFAAVGLAKNQPFALAGGGGMIALAFAQRPESYLFALAAGAGLLIASWPFWKNGAIFAAGGVLGTAASWLFNWHWTGHVLGLPLATRLFGFGLPNAFPVDAYSELTLTPALKVGRLLFHINARDPITFSAAILMFIAILCFFFALRLPAYQNKITLFAGFICTAAASSIWAAIGWQTAVAGLISTLPLLPLSVVYLNFADSRRNFQDQPAGPVTHPPTDSPPTPSVDFQTIYRFIYSTTFIYILIMLLIWPSFGGDQWGARYLLAAYPLLLICAGCTLNFANQNLKRPLHSPFVRVGTGLILLSVLFQLVGVRFLMSQLYGKQSVRDEVAALDAQVIFTNHPFLPSVLSGVSDKQFFYVENEADLKQLVQKSYDNEIHKVGILSLEAGQLTLPDQIDNFLVVPTGAITYQLEPAN